MKLSTLGAVGAALAISAVAGAQSRSNAEVGLGLRVGIVFPTDGGTNDHAGTGFLSFGADVILDPRTPSLFGLKSNLSLSVDYFRRDNYGNIPVTLNYVARSGRYFFNVGAGVGFETTPSQSVTGFAYDAGIGYDLPTTSSLPVFVQVKFLGADRSAVDAFGVYLGVRF